MKKIFYIGVILFLIGISAKAQQTDLLLGQWEYADIYEKENINADELKFLEAFFGDMALHFKNKKDYDAVLMGKNDTGKWYWKENGKKLLITSEKDKSENLIDIIELSADKLIINIDGARFILKRKEEKE